MRSALVFDEIRLREARSPLNRLCIALLDEGVHLVRVVPASFDPRRTEPSERELALIPRIDHDRPRWPWLRRPRRESLLEHVEPLGIDSVIAFGQGAWPTAAEIAEGLDRPLVLAAFDAAERAALRRRRARPAAILDFRSGPPEPEWPEPRDRAGTIVAPLRLGVVAPRCPPPPSDDPDRARAIAVLGRCRSPDRYRALLLGLRRLPASVPWRAVLELAGPREHEVWRLVAELGLLDRVCTVADAGAVGELVCGCDLVAVAEPLDGRVTLLLEAMCCGVAVVATDDGESPVVDRRSGLVVDAAATAEAWSEAIEGLLVDGSLADRLGTAAREQVLATHRSSALALAVAGILERLVQGDAVPFPAGVFR